MDMKSAAEIPVLNSLLKKGPMTVVLVFSPSCTHCHTYMPTWDKMCSLTNKKSNMVRVQSDVYNQTPLASKKSVPSVPTVLFVASDGTIEEATQPRNKTVMANAIKNGMTPTMVSGSVMESANVGSANVGLPANTGSGSANSPDNLFEEANNMPPGTVVQPNPLHSSPATVIPAGAMNTMTGGTRRRRQRQRGGNPFAAALTAAGPAALLMGAYSTLRSSGLGRPIRSSLRRRRH